MTCDLRLMSGQDQDGKGLAGSDPQTVGRWVRGLGSSAMLD